MPPVLYSFRRCPYAIRARLALSAAAIPVILREVELRSKPAAMLAISPKGTVPVLQLSNGIVIEQSLDIMYWALRQNDPQRWLVPDSLKQMVGLIAHNDGEFKYYLDRYKYPDRYPERPASYYRQQAEDFLQGLESRLQQQTFLCGGRFSLVDAAILPFVRQFAAVDSAWFAASDYVAVRNWLENFSNSLLFAAVMTKFPVWQPDASPEIFSGN